MLDKEQANRVEKCRAAERMLAGGAFMRDVALALGVGRSTLERWLAAWRRDGEEALASGRHACGRKPLAEAVPEAFAKKVLAIRARCHSAVLAWQAAIELPDCPAEIVAALKPRFARGGPVEIPLSLRRLVYVQPELEAKRKSDCEFLHTGLKGRHEDMVIDPRTGRERRLLAGDVYLSDDMSVNHPFWFELPAGETQTRAHRGDKLAERWGVAVGRQGLYTLDARGKWLGVDLIGRPSDAYTAADVLRHFRHVVETHGMPRVGWVLEKGVWCAQSVDGLKVVISDEAREATVAGLASLGFAVKHVFTSEGKALVEGAFGRLQNVLDLQDAPTVGRHRGEMERVEAVLRRVRAGSIHPADAGLPHITEELEEVRKAMQWLNERHKAGRIAFGIPDEVWDRDTSAHPLRRLRGDDAAVFLPWKTETALRQGHVTATVDGREYRFTDPELAAALGAGYRVAAAFDPDEPEAGCAVWNLERGSANRRRYAPGQFIGMLEYSAPAPFWGNNDATAAAAVRKKRFTRAFTTAYAGTGIWGTGTKQGVERRGVHPEFDGIEETGEAARVAKTAGGTPAPPAPKRRQMDERDVEREAARADAMEAALAGRGAIWTI